MSESQSGFYTTIMRQLLKSRVKLFWLVALAGFSLAWIYVSIRNFSASTPVDVLFPGPGSHVLFAPRFLGFSRSWRPADRRTSSTGSFDMLWKIDYGVIFIMKYDMDSPDESNPAGLSVLSRNLVISIDNWFLWLLLSTHPSIQLFRWLRTRRRLRAGLCRSCSYDLRAHYSGDKCPECGTAIQLNN
jgi:hypothetical protein